MRKLWDKGYELNEEVEKFTTGDDPEIDMRIIRYDIIASMAHAKMLERIGILSKDEVAKLVETLKELKKLVELGKFKIRDDEEDCHTAIENFLTEKLGDLGKKIHTGRSRNDQVLTVLRMYQKDELMNVKSEIEELMNRIEKFSSLYGETRFAGYTHTRKAMPTDFKTWTHAFLDSLKDDLKFLDFVHNILDRSPLGTGAGYGIPLDLDRRYTAEKLNFSEIQENPIYAQNSRIKFELLILQLLSHITLDLNKVASDLIFFSLPEVGYVELSDSVCTGSSIMPQKKNPDPLEIMRGYHHRIVSNMLFISEVGSNLISGYHRDFQTTKKVIFESFDLVKSSIKIMGIIFENLRVNEKRCRESLDDEVLATERVYELVKKGIPFRDAYKMVAREITKKR